MKSTELPYQAHIDGLRAVAVLAVLGFHAFPAAMPAGFVGVDMFFVISGFLITGILYREWADPASSLAAGIGRFYARRVRRIFPALLVVLAAALGAGYILLVPGEFERLAWHAIAAAGFVLNFVLAGSVGYFDAPAASSPLLHLWSLAIEEQFYLAWPLVVWLTLRLRIKALPVVVFLAACSFFWALKQFPGTEAVGFYLPQMRLWELLLGAIAATLVRPPMRAHPGEVSVPPAPSPPWLDQLVATLGVALVAAGFATIRGGVTQSEAWKLLPTLGTACLVASTGAAWPNRWMLSLRPLVGIGLISYPLYLWHWPLLSFAHIAGDHAPTPGEKTGWLALAFVLATLTYFLIESPIRRRPLHRGVAWALVAAMVAIAGTAWSIRAARGWPGRFPRLMNEIATYAYDNATPTRLGTYFLMGDRDETAFPRDPAEILPGRPTIYLWGDSHAAALYPGLRAVYGDRANLVQRTMAKMAPLPPDSFPPSNFQQIARFVLKSIAQDKPQCVVLAANWPGYEWRQVAQTIHLLRAAGVPRIILVGQVPQWQGSLPQQLFNHVRWHRSDPLPTRLTHGVDPGPVAFDPIMAEFARSQQVEYVSLCAILGNNEGFLVRTGDTPETLVTFDNSHLTASAAAYVVARFPDLAPAR